MILLTKTTVENAACAHYLLSMAIEHIRLKPENKAMLKITEEDVVKAERFLKQSVKALSKEIKTK